MLRSSRVMREDCSDEDRLFSSCLEAFGLVDPIRELSSFFVPCFFVLY